jgi:dTDP-4-dehydrorhamnose reductase
MGGGVTDCAERDQVRLRVVSQTTPKFFVVFRETPNVKLILISTDYVFNGSKTIPHELKDGRNPRSVCGQFRF